MNNYPDPDAAVIAAAREKLDRATAAVTATKLDHANVTIAQRTCTDEKSRLLDLVSAGKTVGAEKFAEIDAAISTNESSLRHIDEIMSRQESAAREAAEEVRKARGIAHRPRVLAAIRELHDAGLAAAVARAALRDAEQRHATACKVAEDAFNAGFPAPLALRPQQHTSWHGYQIPAATHRAALRSTWGALADEALSDLAEA